MFLWLMLMSFSASGVPYAAVIPASAVTSSRRPLLLLEPFPLLGLMLLLTVMLVRLLMLLMTKQR